MNLKINQKDVANLVDTQIRFAIMEALGKEPEKIIQVIVKESLEMKRNPYDGKTIFQTAIEGMINEAAREVFKEWLDTKKQVIKDAIVERLQNEESVFFETLANKIVEGFASSFTISASLRIK